MKKIFLVIISVLSLQAVAQNPVPAKPQSKRIILFGGTAHLGNGKVITNSVIEFDKGKLTVVGEAAAVKINKDNADYFDVTGKHIYPGLVSLANHVGLADIESIPAVNDYEETGNINPNVRALIAYNADSEIIPTVRGNGILISQASPEGGLVTGQSSIFEMEGWNWQDAVLKTDDGIWLNWPSFLSRQFNPETFSFTTARNEQRNKSLQELDKTFNDAVSYSEGKPTVYNLKMEAMKGLFDGSKTLYVRTDFGKEIIEAVQFAKAHKVKKIVIVGGAECNTVFDFLKENNVPVVLGGVHELPARADNDVYLPYKLPAMLHKAGILAAISYSGLSWRTRNLPYLAGTTAAFGGIDKEEALKLITSNPAKILGIDDKVGTLEVGKHATILVCQGDILDMKTSIVEMAFIQGKKVDLDDKQKRLYRKFSEKLGK
ncbi:MAG: amidohydrolase family protein [Spirosomataceae bacterium]